MTILKESLKFVPKDITISCNNGKNYTKEDCEKTLGDLPIRRITCNHTINGGGLLIIKTKCGLKFTVMLPRLEVVMFDVLEDLYTKLGKDVYAVSLKKEILITCRNPFKENCTFDAFGKNFTLKWNFNERLLDGKSVLAQNVIITLHSDDGTQASHVLNF